MSNLQQVIEAAFEKRAEITPKTVDAQTRAAIEEVIEGLDSGKYRVAEKIDGEWVTHQWLKKAVLLSFRINDNQIIDGAETKYYDKVALKFADYTEERFAQEGFRVVPSATVRKGAYISKNCVLMPSYVNIGAYVGEGTMVDTWAVSDDQGWTWICFSFCNSFHQLVFVCAHSYLCYVYITIRHSHHAKVFFLSTFTRSCELSNCCYVSGFRSLTTSVGVYLSIEYEDVDVFARS